MADYTTYATLIAPTDLIGVKEPDRFSSITTLSDGRKVMLCLESDPKFNSLSQILGINKEELPVVSLHYIKATFWKKHGWNEYKGDDFRLAEIDWLNSKGRRWSGTEEEYHSWVNDEDGAKELYVDVQFGSMEEEYPPYKESEHSYMKAVRCIVFELCGYGDAKAGYFSNWLGEGAMHGEFDCVIFAKDAAKHFDYEHFSNDFDWADGLVKDVEAFAQSRPDETTLLFGFG